MIQRDKHGWHILHAAQIDCGADRVATVYDNRERARLYDAAPDLLRACKLALSGMDEGLINGNEDTVSALRYAIAKAVGNQAGCPA